jgi:putative ABC transport system permease protein
MRRIRGRSPLRHARLQLVLASVAIAVAVALPVILVSVGGGVSAHEIAQLEQSGYVISVSAAGVHGVSQSHALVPEFNAIASVAASSPVLSVPIDVYHGGRTPTPVLAEGVIPQELTPTLGPSEAGLFPSPLPLGDPTDMIHYANGTYTGPAVYDVLISTPFAAASGVRPGQTVVLSPTTNESVGISYHVTGAFGVPSTLLGPTGAFAVIVPLSDLQVLTGFARTSSTPSALLDSSDTVQVALSGSAENDPAQINAVAAHIQSLVPYYGVSTQLQQAQQLQNADAILTGFYLALSSVGLAVGLIFLAIVLIRRVESDRRSIGIRRALGLPPRWISADILERGLALAAAGIVGGTALGIIVISVLTSYGTGAVQQAASLTVYDPVLLASIAAGVLVLALVASGLAARAALRVDIVEALR